MVIVTQNQYILASKIHHVTLDEQSNHMEVKNTRGRYRTVERRYWQLTVIYSPEDIQTNSITTNRGEYRECCVTLLGAVNAHKVFKDLIQQIREQMPDSLYLDTALERMIAGTDIKSLEDRDFYEKEQLEEAKSDRLSKEIRRARKKKRTSQKVLRGAKSSRRGSKK